MKTLVHRSLLLLLLLMPGLLAQPAGGAGPDFLGRYDAALERFRAGDYAPAQTALENLLGSDDLRADYQDNCYFWIGECQYARKNYLDALASFFKVLEFPWPNKDADARMKIALCWFNLGDRPRACLEAGALAAREPDGPFGARARRLKELACADADR